MSILNGSTHHSLLSPEPEPYGKPFREVGEIIPECQSCADVRAVGEQLIALAGRGMLELHRVKPDGSHEFVSRLSGLGDSRQLYYSDGFAYLSARADGLYIIDLRTPEAPILAYHLDSLELATGVDVSGGILAITNRHMGCELHDVRDPYNPKFIASFLCGEAQSVRLHKNLALIGDWMNKQTRIFDISNPKNARELSRFEIDGFADGVCSFERDGRTIALCASGHHARRLRNRIKYKFHTYFTPEMITDGWGCGHGVTVFDITDPTMPEFLSELKAPPLFGGLDTWRIFTDGNYAWFTDSMNGILELDLTELTKPRFTHFYRHPPSAKQLPSPSIQLQCGVIIGAETVSGFVAAAGTNGVKLLAPTDSREIGELIKSDCTVEIDSEASADTAENQGFTRFCEPIGQLHSFVKLGSRIYCAEGDAGISIRSIDGKLLSSFKTAGICADICKSGEYLITAESDRGVALYSIEKEELHERSRVEFDITMTAREVVVSGRKIAVQLGSGCVAELELSDDGSAKSAHLTHKCTRSGIGMTYHRHLAKASPSEGFIANTLNHGPVLFCEQNGRLEKLVTLNRETCPFAEGACAIGEKLICILRGRYYCLENPLELSKIASDELCPISCQGARLSGMPFVLGTLLVLLNRYDGRIELIDVSKPEQPRFMKRVETGLYPEFADSVDGKLLVACGHDGIIEIGR